MKFQELKKSLTTIKPIYLIRGSDAFLRDKAVEMIVNHSLKIKDLNLIIFNDENTDILAIVSACKIIPMMDEHRVVVLKDIAVKKADELKPLIDYATQPLKSTVLIIVDSANNTVYKKLEALSEIVDCSPLDTNMLTKLVVSQLNNLKCKINSDAVSILIEYCNFDYTRINNEVIKLGNLVGANGLITKQIVQDNVNREVEYDVFELGNAVAVKDGAKTLAIINQLLEQKQSPQMLMMLVLSNFRRMFYAIMSRDTNLTIANKLGIKEFAVKKAREVGLKFTPAQLKKILDLGAELDYQIKAGQISDKNALLYFVSNIVK